MTADVQRAGALYLPIFAALLAGILRRPRHRQMAATLLAALWTLPTLMVLQMLNRHAGWWSFEPGAVASLRGMPLELLLGWAVLWGIVPQLVWPRAGLVARATALVVLDCVLMPACAPAVRLHAHWLLGEAVAVVLVLLPALCLAQWTRQRRHVRRRAALQIALAGLLFLFFLPELTFALRPGQGWSALWAGPRWALDVETAILLALAVPGIAAVCEFARRGGGTPIPYDPPRRLVTSGVYRYVANPMQLSCTLVLLAWAAMLRNGWLLIPPAMAVLYSAGLATWDEADDLQRRFRTPWLHYRAVVRDWLPRLRPYHAGPAAVVYLARECGPCSQVRAWIERQHPAGLLVLDAETLPAGSIRRIRYDPCDGTAPVEGIRAMARVLEHLHLGWAWCGAALGLPVVAPLVQRCTDAAGLGPRAVVADACNADAFSTVPHGAIKWARPRSGKLDRTCSPPTLKQTCTPNGWKS